MKSKKNSYIVLLFFLFTTVLHLSGIAQKNNDEIWPEIDGIYKVNKQIRLMGQYSLTKKESQYTDGSLAFYFDYFTLPFFRKARNTEEASIGYFNWLRIGYSYSHSSANQNDLFKEHMINLESNTRFHLPKKILATVKNRFDFRINNGNLSERYRPRLTLERDCKTEYLTFTPYVYGEYYLNFNKSSSNRYRLCLGTEIWATKNISLEIYYIRQFEQGPTSSNVNAIGTVFKVNLQNKHLITNPKEEKIRNK